MPRVLEDGASFVSVVIPAYNHGRFVEEAIESVLAQDYPHVELIVIDDGSTDHTRAVLERYRNRARVLFQTNVGQSATINRGWSIARGDLLGYLSADDRLEQGALRRAVTAFAQHRDAVAVYGDYDLIDPDSRIIRRVIAPEFEYARVVREFVCPPGPGAFLRRSAADRLTGWDPHLRQAPDFDYWLRLAMIGPIIRIPWVMAAQRVHPGSASYAPTTIERAEEPVRIMLSYFSRTDLTPSIQAAKGQALSSAHLLAARAHIRAGRYRVGLRSLATASILAPGNMIRMRTGRLLLNAVINRPAHRILWHARALLGGARRRLR